MKRKIAHFIISVFAVMMTIIVITPVIMTIVMSFRNGWETYVDLAIWEPAYTHAMSNSIIISFAASAGSIVIAIPAAFAFAKRGFKGSGALFGLYVIAMIMPFQITLLPQYIVSKRLMIYDTGVALILPGIFAPFSVFLMTQNMKMMSDDVIEYAVLDTSSTFRILWHIVIPIMRPAVICTFILSFSEQWNAVAEPLILLETADKFPMAILFDEIGAGDVLAFAAASVFMIIPLMLFVIYNEEISEGMAAYQLK